MGKMRLWWLERDGERWLDCGNPLEFGIKEPTADHLYHPNAHECSVPDTYAFVRGSTFSDACRIADLLLAAEQADMERRKGMMPLLYVCNSCGYAYIAAYIKPREPRRGEHVAACGDDLTQEELIQEELAPDAPCICRMVVCTGCKEQ